MAPNPRVTRAFRAMRSIGIIEEKVKPVLKNLLKLYDKNWELIEEENYRALADAIFDQEETRVPLSLSLSHGPEQKKKHENTDTSKRKWMKKLRCKKVALKEPEDHVSPSFGLGETSSRGPPKVEEADLPETCPEQRSQDMTESSQPLVRNKEKQHVLPKPVSIQDSFEPSQPEPLSKENSSSANGSIGASDGPERIVSQSVEGEARNDGVLASSNERRTDCKLANNVDGSSSNLDVASSHYGESQIPRLPSSSNGIDDCTQTDKNTIENIGEIDEEKEQNNDIKSLHDANDIAKGQERVVISLVNEVNNECPPSFHYIPKNAVFQNAYVNFSLARIGENCCSICLGDCLSSSTPCACANEIGGDFAYTLEGLVKDERSENDDVIEPCKGHLVRKFIKECWWKCGSSKQCGNRVVQRGISCNLQVFMTPRGKGRGLPTNSQRAVRGVTHLNYILKASLR
ncbi:Histone-lysine N-methyltransferase SUVR4 [Camellia lanceoleosa]|uniref:Histone-lysine N-methyltransferase SUVR4 n=1 Tax=Camellia lanceoleosa TaxID=1840588 RepID=A0ACC0HFL4_9ERIC|nr:Histone-lysine N-methyltransferase SUVR4 [Camellia lanceoleosa]